MNGQDDPPLGQPQFLLIDLEIRDRHVPIMSVSVNLAVKIHCGGYLFWRLVKVTSPISPPPGRRVPPKTPHGNTPSTPSSCPNPSLDTISRGRSAIIYS